MSNSFVAQKSTMRLAGNQPGWRFWLLWVLATTAGWVLGRFLGDGLVTLIPPLANPDVPVRTTLVVGGVLSGVVSGAVVGAAQWLVLQEKVSRVGRWVLATALGFPVGWSLVLILAYFVGGPVFWFGFVFEALFGVIVGVVVGAAQWLVLREKVSQARWWILASFLGWGYLSLPLTGPSPAGFLVGQSLRSLLEAGGITGPVAATLFRSFAGGVAAIVAGCITGGALVWLLRQPAPDDDKTDQTRAILALDVDDEQNAKPGRLRDKNDVSNRAAAGTGTVTGALTMLIIIIGVGVIMSPTDPSVHGEAAGVVLVLYLISSVYFMIVALLTGALGGMISGKIGYPSGKIGPAIGGVVLTIMVFICSMLRFGFYPPIFLF